MNPKYIIAGDRVTGKGWRVLFLPRIQAWHELNAFGGKYLKIKLEI